MAVNKYGNKVQSMKCNPLLYTHFSDRCARREPNHWLNALFPSDTVQRFRRIPTFQRSSMPLHEPRRLLYPTATLYCVTTRTRLESSAQISHTFAYLQTDGYHPLLADSVPLSFKSVNMHFSSQPAHTGYLNTS